MVASSLDCDDGLPGELKLRPLFATVDDDDDDSMVVHRSDKEVALEMGGDSTTTVRVAVSPRRQARGIDGDDGTEGLSETGAVVWDGTIFLAKRLPVFPRGAVVLELGAGCGLLSLACAARGATSVVVTDRSHRIEALRSNVTACAACRVEALDWRDPNVELYGRPFDYVVAADVVYDVALVGPLVDTIRKALFSRRRRSAVALVAADVSIGRTAAYEAFEDRCRRTFADVDVQKRGRFAEWRLRDPLPTAVLCFGVCGAGKTTLAERLVEALDDDDDDDGRGALDDDDDGRRAVFVEGDDLHPHENRDKMARGLPLTDDDRADWLDACANAILAASQSHIVVLACSALTRDYRRRVVDALQGRRRLVAIFLAASEDLIMPRVERRRTQGTHFMPPSLVESQFATLQRPTPDEFDHAGTLLELDAATSTDDQVRTVLRSGALPL